MSILANSETFFSHGRMGVFYKIFLKELNRIDEKKKRKKLDAKKERQFLSSILFFVYWLGKGRIEFNKILC